MAVRILLLLLAFFIVSNLVISIVSVIFGVNLYKTHGRAIMKGWGFFILFIAAVFVIFSAIGLL